MRRFLIFLSIAVVLVGGIWCCHGPSHPPRVDASRYETDMIEVLVRRVLTDLKSPVPSICFLAFGDGTTPPSDSFLARFDGTRPALRSCGSAAMPMDGKQFEISTGKPGVIIHIIEFKKAANGSFEALVRFSDLPEGKNRFTYRLANVAGKWEVKGRRSA